MKINTRKLLFGAAVALLASCCVAATSGSEPPPAVPGAAPPPPPPPPAAPNDTAAAGDHDRPGSAPTTEVVPEGTTEPAETTTTPSTPTTTASPYSIYDVRHYMDEESLAREEATASRRSPSYDAAVQSPSYDAAAQSSGYDARLPWGRFATELTTPSVPYFDRKHSDIVAGIEHGIEQAITSHRLQDTNSSERKEESSTTQRAETSTMKTSYFLSSKPSDVRLDFSNRVEIVFNDTKGPASVRRDLVVINGTHIDLEINRTTVYPIEEVSTVSYHEQTTMPEEIHQQFHSDINDDFTHPATTTDIPGTTYAATNILRSRLDNSFSANSVEREITTVSPGEINSTTNIIIISETNRSELTTEISDVQSTTEAFFSVRDSVGNEPVNVSRTVVAVPEVNETDSAEDVNVNIISTTFVYDPNVTTSRRPPWVPLKAQTTASDLSEVRPVSTPRSSRGRMMSSNASSANSLDPSDTQGSGSDVEVLTTESPEENTVYPLRRSTPPSLLTDSNVLSNTRKKIYTFKSTHVPKTTTTTPSFPLLSTSPTSTLDNVITVERSSTLKVGLVPSNHSALNNERNDISNIYSIPLATSRNTIRLTSKSVNNTVEAVSVSPTATLWASTDLKGRSHRFDQLLNTSAQPLAADDQETSYVRVPTVEKPKNSSQWLSGPESNITTTRTRFTPLGPSRIRTVAVAGRNSSEWPHSFSKIYIFPSTAFPPFNNTTYRSRTSVKQIPQNQTSFATEAPNDSSSENFTVSNRDSDEGISTTEMTTTLLPNVTFLPAMDTRFHNFSTFTRPYTSPNITLHTILFPTTDTTTTDGHTDPSNHTLPSTTEPWHTDFTTSLPGAVATAEPDETTESVPTTTTQVPETTPNQVHVTVFPPLAAESEGTVSAEGGLHLNGSRLVSDGLPGVPVYNGSIAGNTRPNDSRPVSDDPLGIPVYNGTAVRNGSIAGNTRPNGSRPVSDVPPGVPVHNGSQTPLEEPPEAAVRNGSIADDTRPNGSKPALDVPPGGTSHHGGVDNAIHANGSAHEEDGLPEEEHRDAGHPWMGWSPHGPPRVQPAHEDRQPPLDDLDYGGGGVAGNDLDAAAGNTTAEPGVTARIPTPTTTTTSAPPATDTTTLNSTGVMIPSQEKVSAYLLLLTDASWYDVCQLGDTFRTAVASLLTQASNKVVQSKQVILLNVSPALCSEVMHKEDGSEKQLIPIEFYLTDSSNKFDLQMCQEFRDVWKNHHLEYPYPVRSVELISTAYIAPNTTAIVSEDNSTGAIAAIVISCVGIVSLVLLAVLVFVLMRKRQKRFNYGQRCTPVSLDAYSLDSVSVCNSVRRKAARASKRSYGNPAFDDPNAPSRPINFAGLANFSSDVAALEEEFAMIPQLSPKVDEMPPGAEAKNRYANVIPLPETRVTLQPVEGEPLSDYINANFVRGPKGVEKFYIACQAPLPTTITDFWRMVWEQQCKVILMLTDLVEDGKEKCADYLPPSEVTDCHRLFGDFQITLKKREVKDKYIISTLQIKNLESNLWRELTHLWYLGWPARGVPGEAASLVALLVEARSHARAGAGPIVAHCSPGTGRTGAVLACDLCMRDFEQTRSVDVPRCVSRLRRDRAGAVQTKEQYVFIYQVLNLYATKLTGGALDSL
ncbi:mucin-5AC-like [Bacillus rossius redtenbacheri]|uniref:mucin-5AC-like n=1 Tax=Bacillus rossius redtenbacheri TaxID=93214 RepID=UPI002FDD0D77